MSSKNKSNALPLSYAYSRENIPFPELTKDKTKPPVLGSEHDDNSEMFKKKEASQQEQAQKFMDDYRKVERAIVCNFYTGGGKSYTKGILDSLYRGFNPLNPNM